MTVEGTALSQGASHALADRAGIFASVACAIHCAAMPMVIGYLPYLGMGWLANEAFHRVMAVVCFLLAAAAFVPGWRKHRSMSPGLMGVLGVSLLTVAAFGIECECCDQPSEVAQAQTEEAACEDATCQHCLSLAEAEAASATPQPALAAALPPWSLPLITPLGGVLLVAGHLANHRKNCCCTGSTCCQEPIGITPLGDVA